MFIIGSLCYYPFVEITDKAEWGGILFTIGSAGFLFSDCFEWSVNNRVGCAFYTTAEGIDFDRFHQSSTSSSSSFYGKLLSRAENGLNFAMSAVGSLLYLIGSVFFIPNTHGIFQGTELFIYGSLVIFFSQMWKLFRQGLDPIEKKINVKRYWSDLINVFVNSFLGLGAVLFFVGSIFFLPQYNTSEAVTIIAVNLFVIGSVAFLLSSLCIFYRYFFTENWILLKHAIQSTK